MKQTAKKLMGICFLVFFWWLVEQPLRAQSESTDSKEKAKAQEIENLKKQISELQGKLMALEPLQDSEHKDMEFAEEVLEKFRKFSKELIKQQSEAKGVSLRLRDIEKKFNLIQGELPANERPRVDEYLEKITELVNEIKKSSLSVPLVTPEKASDQVLESLGHRVEQNINSIERWRSDVESLEKAASEFIFATQIRDTKKGNNHHLTLIKLQNGKEVPLAGKTIHVYLQYLDGPEKLINSTQSGPNGVAITPFVDPRDFLKGTFLVFRFSGDKTLQPSHLRMQIR